MIPIGKLCPLNENSRGCHNGGEERGLERGQRERGFAALIRLLKLSSKKGFFKSQVEPRLVISIGKLGPLNKNSRGCKNWVEERGLEREKREGGFAVLIRLLELSSKKPQERSWLFFAP